MYIIQSRKNNRYYVGSTKNVQNRLIEHNAGKTRSTRHYIPWKVVFYKSYGNLNKAGKVERKIKKAKSRKIIEMIIRDGSIKMGP